MKIGLGVGLGLGIPLILALGFWFGLRAFKARRASPNDFDHDNQDSNPIRSQPEMGHTGRSELQSRAYLSELPVLAPVHEAP